MRRSCMSVQQQQQLVRPWWCLVVVVVFLLLGCGRRVQATITVLDTGQKFASKQNRNGVRVGKKLWKGYEYYSRLQYIPDNMVLCDSDDDKKENNNSHNHTIIVPEDGVPVSLLVRGGGGCSLEDKAKYALNNIYPKNLVRYIIVDEGTTVSKTEQTLLLGDEDEVEDEIEAEIVASRVEEAASFSSPSSEQRLQNPFNWILPVPTQQQDDWLLDGSSSGAAAAAAVSKHNNQRHHDDDEPQQKNVDLPLYVLHVSYATEYQLFDLLLHQQSDETKLAGGPRITIDSRTSSTAGGGTVLWIAITAMLSACACSFLLIANNGDYFWEEQEQTDQTGPTRPQRRRLTREQVRDLLPTYRYDGERLEPVLPRRRSQQQEQPLLRPAAAVAAVAQDEEAIASAGSEQPATHGLVAAAAASGDAATTTVEPPSIHTLDLELCSICLDEYEPGDKLRVLPCQHAFHSKCVGKWLSERSAVCPLCKEDLYIEEEEEEEGADENEGNGNERLLTEAEISPEAVGTFWNRVYRTLASTARDDEVDDEDEPTMAEAAAAAAAAAAEAERSRTTTTRPWWSRLFSTDSTLSSRRGTSNTIEMLTEPLLAAGGNDAEGDLEAPPPMVAQEDDGEAEEEPTNEHLQQQQQQQQPEEDHPGAQRSSSAACADAPPATESDISPLSPDTAESERVAV